MRPTVPIRGGGKRYAHKVQNTAKHIRCKNMAHKAHKTVRAARIAGVKVQKVPLQPNYYYYKSLNQVRRGKQFALFCHLRNPVGP